MSINFNLKSVVIVATAIMLTNCSNYSANDIKQHREKIKTFQDSYESIKNTAKKPVITQEIEIFDKKVSVTFFNESLKNVLLTIVPDVKYAPGIDKNIAVSLEANRISVLKALHKILKPIGLTYIRTTGGILVIKQKLITFKAFNQPLDIVLNAMLGDISFMVRDGAEKSLKSPVSIEFKDLPIEMALDRMLSQLNLFWKKESKSYIIFRDREELFSVNFPLLQQTFNVSSSRQNSSSDDDSDSGIAPSSSSLVTSGTSASLSNLTDTIERFLSDEGKVVVHKEMGMIWVKDKAFIVDRIGEFLAKINENLSKSVAISGIITEVELNDGNKTGIDWTSVAGNLTRAGGSIGATGGAVGSNFTLGWKSAGSVNKVYLSALKTFGDVEVISRPSLRIANNAIGSLIVGKNTSYVSEVVATASSSAPTTYASKLSSLQTGLSFYVLPHIISATEAILYISPELTSLQSLTTVGTNGVQAPTITMRQTQTVVPIKNGESLVIGGLMSESDKSTRGKTPLLGSVPLLGGLFQTEDSSKGVSEFSLMVKVSW